MKRRALLAGIPSTAATGILVGSGAFTNVAAERRVNVETADDNEAFLALKQLGDGKYSVGGRSIENGSPGVVQFSFPGLGERVNDDELGLGKDSVYEFGRDSGESQDNSPTEGLLRIRNQGTQFVDVYAEHETDSELEIELYDVTDPNHTLLRDDPVVLDVGEHVNLGFRIRTFGVDVGTYDETLTIVAERPDG